MGRKGKETTEEERKIIIRLHTLCKSLSEISKIVQRPRATIQTIINRYGERKSLQNLKRYGRPCKINKYTGRTIIRNVVKNPRISAPKLAAAVKNAINTDVSSSTVRRFLYKNGYRGRTARRKFYVSETNARKRLEFANTYRNKNYEFWKRWIFTDESKFNIFSSDGRVKVWRKKNTELEKHNLLPTVKYGGGSVLVWGCMSAEGVGTLEIIDGIMDQYKYIGILKRNIRPSAEKMGLTDNYIFMQDNDPKHTALDTRLWILYNTPKYLPTPPQSPDVNPIEHLWEYLDERIRTRQITSKEALKTALLEEWNNIPESRTSQLVKSMPRRLEEVIARKGYPTKY